MSAEEEAYHELSAYTIETADARFIHQHVVDCWGAQTATADAKPIRLIFSLAGLYLHLEKGTSGRDVQKIHGVMGARRREWPRLALPDDRGAITAIDVMKAAPGADRERAIDEWCRSIWTAYAAQRGAIIDILKELGIS